MFIFELYLIQPPIHYIMKKPVLFLASVAVAVSFAFMLPKDVDTKPIHVVIDAAHGGKDFGADYNGILEKQLTDAVAQKIKERNKDSEIVLHFTRTDDTFMSLEERVNAINAIKPDLVLSLHVNASFKNTDRSGMEFFISDASSSYQKSAELTKKLANKFESEKFTVAVINAPFYMLKRSTIPAVVFEMGYLSNKTDREYLTNPKSQEQIAAIVLDFIEEIK